MSGAAVCDGRRFGRAVAALALAMTVCAALPVGVSAQEPAAAPEAAPETGEGEHAANPEDRKRVAAAAGYLLLIVVLTGLLCFVLLVLWGFRVRRMSRQSSSRISPTDELWYLRPSKQKPPGNVPPAGPPPPGDQDSDRT